MNELFDTLCSMLDDELERQENILAICRAQAEAARAYDVEHLEARTAALLPLLRDAALAEPLRSRLLDQIALNDLNVQTPEPGRPTLREVAEIAPEPWMSRLRHYQWRLREVLDETRAVVQANATALRTSLRVVGQALKAVDQTGAPASPGYSADGFEPASGIAQPALMDQRG